VGDLLSSFGRKLSENIFLETPNHDSFIQQDVEFAKMRCSVKVPTESITMSVTITKTKWNEAPKEIRTETLKLRKQLNRA
jgi:hypothetical protein